jgi:hypothetical protein
VAQRRSGEAAGVRAGRLHLGRAAVVPGRRRRGGAQPADPNTPIDADTPDKTWSNGTFTGRAYTYLAGWETAVYGSYGHFGQPRGFDSDTGSFFFPSWRPWGPAPAAPCGGIANAEVAWYDSIDDTNGDDPLVANSEFRALLGYSHKLVTDQNLGLQAYLERALDHHPAPGFTDRNRVWLTLRYTGMFLQQNLILSLFTFYSPTEQDSCWRPKVTYKLSDEVQLTGGAHVFAGGENDTCFGQFEDNTNVYARVRYSF